MFKKEYLISYIKWGLVAAIVFCIPMLFFLSADDYASTWWLFVGNVLFLGVIAVYMLALNKSKNENASTQTMVAAGHIATVVGILFSVVVGAIALPIFIPDIYSSGQSDRVMQDSPASLGTGKTHGLVFVLFMNTVLGNICGGSFSSLIVPYTAKKNQTKDRKSEVLNN